MRPGSGIQTRIRLAFVLIAAMALAATALAVWALVKVDRDITEIHSVQVPRLVEAYELARLAQSVALRSPDLFEARSENELETAHSVIRKELGLLKALHDRVAASHAGVSNIERDRERITLIGEHIDELAVSVKSAITLRQRAEPYAVIVDANRFALHRLDRELWTLSDSFTSVANVSRDGIDKTVSLSHSLQTRTARTLMFLGVFAILASALFTWIYVDRSISRRLHHTIAGAHEIAKGNYDVELESGAGDEIGSLADALRVFKMRSVAVEEKNVRALQVAQSRLEDAIANIPDSFAIYDRDDRLVLYNQAWVELTGTGRVVSRGMPLSEVFEVASRQVKLEPGQTREGWINDRLMRRKSPGEDFLIELSDGRWINVRESRTEDGGTVGTYTDVTEIKSSEVSLAQAIDGKERAIDELQAVLNAMDYGVLILDADTRVRLSNQAVRDMWEIDDALIDRSPTIRHLLEIHRQRGSFVISDDEWPAFVEKTINGIRMGKSSPVELHLSDGRTLLYRCFALSHGARLLSYFDVTPMKRIEEELREKEERYKFAMDGSREGLWDWHDGDNRTHVSRRFRELTGLDADVSVVDLDDVMARIHPDDKSIHTEKMAAHFRGEVDQFDAEYRMRDASDTYRWVRNRARGIKNESGRIVRVTGWLGDIDARKNAEMAMVTAKEQAEQANRVKSQFLANMSHELRTPLNAIIGITEMVLEEAREDGDDTYDDPLGRVHRAGKHLLLLISELLDLARIEAGRLDLLLETVSLNSLLGDAGRTVEPLAQENQNQLEINIQKNIGQMNADPTRLRQIVLNLLGNACKFTRDGVVQLNARREMTNSGEMIRIEVTDTGIGMTDLQIAQIFDEFTQADSSMTRQYGGTGLGLTISDRLCRLMGGHIDVKSEPGKGSRFTVTLPVVVPVAVLAKSDERRALH